MRVAHMPMLERSNVALVLGEKVLSCDSFVDEIFSIADDIECLEPKEVEFDEACDLYFVFIELGDDFAVLPGEKRHVLNEGLFTNDNSGGVHSGLSIEAFKHACGFKYASINGVGFGLFFELGRKFKRLVQIRLFTVNEQGHWFCEFIDF